MFLNEGIALDKSVRSNIKVCCNACYPLSRRQLFDRVFPEFIFSLRWSFPIYQVHSNLLADRVARKFGADNLQTRPCIGLPQIVKGVS